MTTLKFACLQTDIVWESPPDNFDPVAARIARAAELGADVIVLPEMFATGFSMNPSLAQDVDGPIASFLTAQAARHRVCIIAGIMLTGSPRPANGALVFDRTGTVMARYHKVHLFAHAGENEVLAPGDGPVVFALDGLRCSVFICFDLRFPELFRPVAEQVDAMVVLASWPGSRQQHFDTLLEARAIENQCYVVGVNRVGQGGGIAYDGGSAIIAPGGQVLQRMYEEDTIVSAAVDTGVVARIRRDFPFLPGMTQR